MNGPAALIVLVGAGESSEPTTVAMDRAARAALDDTMVEVREAHTPAPTDEEALALERATHPVAVVELKWSDGSRRKATLRVHLADEARWVERAIGFRSSDAFAERGRTLGFAVVSMLPEGAGRRGGVGAGAGAGATTTGQGTSTQTAASTPTPSSTSTPTSTSTSTSTPTSTPTSTSTPTPTPTSTSTSTSTPTPTSTSTSTPTPTSTSTSTSAATATAPAPALTPSPSPSPSPLPPAPFSLTLLAIASLGVETSPTTYTYGGAATFDWSPLALVPALALRAGASLRAGSLQGADGSTLTFVPSVGGEWRVVPREGRPFGGAARVEYLLVDQQVTHFASGHATTQGTGMSGMGAALDAELRVSPSANLVLGIGVEEVFSPTYIHVQGAVVAELPSTRLTAEAGVRLGL